MFIQGIMTQEYVTCMLRDVPRLSTVPFPLCMCPSGSEIAQQNEEFAAKNTKRNAAGRFSGNSGNLSLMRSIQFIYIRLRGYLPRHAGSSFRITTPCVFRQEIWMYEVRNVRGSAQIRLIKICDYEKDPVEPACMLCRQHVVLPGDEQQQYKRNAIQYRCEANARKAARAI